MDSSNRNDDDAADEVCAREPMERAPPVAGQRGAVDDALKLSATARVVRQLPRPRHPIDVHLVIAGIAKRRNVVALLQTAVAFGVKKVLVVGQENNLRPSSLPAFLQTLLSLASASSTDTPEEGPLVGGDEQSPYLNLVRFHKWHNVVEYLRQREIRLVGVEIHPDAITVSELLENHIQGSDGEDDGRQNEGRRRRAIALVMGNEGDGLSQAQMDACQHFVRIPQYGSGTASLNVAVAASIVLHQCHTYQMSLLCDDGTHETDREANRSAHEAP